MYEDFCEEPGITHSIGQKRLKALADSRQLRKFSMEHGLSYSFLHQVTKNRRPISDEYIEKMVKLGWPRDCWKIERDFDPDEEESKDLPIHGLSARDQEIIRLYAQVSGLRREKIVADWIHEKCRELEMNGSVQTDFDR